MNDLTPMRRQYLQFKNEYPDCILLFRLGDFYETFDDDAETVARELDITLTSRPVSKNQRIPMAGVPHHAVESYVARLIEKGFHVAVCDQVSEPDGRGIVEREVTRVITPGTIIEPNLLRDEKPNYLMAILPVGHVEGGRWDAAGVAYCDITTGEFAVTELSGENTALLVLEELARLTPREVLLPQTWAERGVTFPREMSVTVVPDWKFEYKTAESALTAHFRVRTLDGYGVNGMTAGIGAAGAMLLYVQQTQRGRLAQLSTLRAYSTASFMVLDQFTRRNLELTETLHTREAKGSLLGVLDRTVTAMGARLLRTWITQPLLDLPRLNARLDAVEALTKNEPLRAEIREVLKGIIDLERLTNRLLIGRVNPRDLIALRSSLEKVPALRTLISALSPLAALMERLDPCDDAHDLILRAITDDPPAALNAMGVIRPDYSDELAQVLNATQEARDWIANLESVERRRTGIASLKVGYNKNFGYFIEITHANVDKIPDNYMRKQTLVNAERYITPELKDYETQVLNAEEQILDLERRLFDEVCKGLAAHTEKLLTTARALAHLDVFTALADVAMREGYTRPTLTEDDLLIIRDGRHPVVERLLPDGGRYTPNETHFDTMSRIHIITGPNMSGKSTYIRQVALIALMAQIGSFVPADEATIGLVDRIFARIGAHDEIHAGYSTFMVEMVETARLLSGSTRRSLLILDEVGRGTSTYDGLAIARAVIEYIHNDPRLNCRTLFATHYHELIELPNILPRARNFSAAVSDAKGEIVFMHKIVPGGADRSYGVHVAQIAGMPRPVIDRAAELLRHLEANGSRFELPTTRQRRENPAQLKMFDDQPHPVLVLLRDLNVDALSPIEALTKLYELKKMAQER
jgi:DNA mismatch repair protein MutS